MSEVILRLVHVNDVYELEEFPHLSTLFQESKKGANLCLLTLGGDFLAPSLLSGIDHGKGMVEVMNATGVTHVCFGNHEADIPVRALYDRIKEFKGKWINTNMPGFKVKSNDADNEMYSLPEYTIETATSQDGSNVKKIGILGLLCGYPTLYLSGAFDHSIPSVIPVNQCAVSYKERLQREEKVDFVIPMTHQDVADDMKLLEAEVFPIILGGHDHKEYYEKHTNKNDGNQIHHLIKTGADAHKAAIIDFVWKNKETKSPEISYKVVTVKDSPADEKVVPIIRKHLTKLEALEKAIIYREQRSANLLTSKEMRLHQTTIGTLFCTAFREVYEADCALIDAGGIRGNQDYPHFCLSLSDIRKELPFPSELVVVDMDGETISKAVQYSRQKENKAEFGGYYQVDDRVIVDPQTHLVTHIDGEPLEESQTYQVVFSRVTLDGMNNNQPVIDWAQKNKEKIPPMDTCRPAKPLILEYFAAILWKRLPPFDEIDTNNDGSLSKEEVKNAYLKVFSADTDNDNFITETERAAVEFVVDTLVDSLNTNKDNKIDRAEYESLLGSSRFSDEDKPEKLRRKRDILILFVPLLIIIFILNLLIRAL